MSKTVTLRVDDETYRNLNRWAGAENRSVSNFIETAVKEHVRHSAFVDDAEMAGILADERLVERLKRGSRDARRKKGRFAV
ncbi:MAG: ribbon-helix-helix protein, CopG family [Nitrospirae bacterium]|nr:ribbon-helix-helix protein, CopG family [Nitrospirota bacterium]